MLKSDEQSRISRIPTEILLTTIVLNSLEQEPNKQGKLRAMASLMSRSVLLMLLD